MHELTRPHLDDFTLLRYTAGDLDDIERRLAARHIEACAVCSQVLREIDELDQELKLVMPREERRSDLEEVELAHDDPFRTRPEQAPLRPPLRIPAGELARVALAASERSGAVSERILDAAAESGRVKPLLAELSLSDPVNRYGLLYALQEGGRRIAESPVRTLLFAEAALVRFRHSPPSEEDERVEAETVVPLLTLRGQAHLLAGQACNWTGDFEKARTHFELAYRCFARAGGDEVSLASVEYHESQRRSFTGSGREGVLLARRAEATFKQMGLEDNVARAQAAEGVALSMLGRDEEAVEAFRGGLAVFERMELWSNYVAAVNSIGTCLVRLGRLDEARREFARALRRVSRERRSSSVAFIRDGLAQVFFSARRFREAAVSFAQATRLYVQSGLLANALIASLFEIESWARQGDMARARHRLEIFRTGVAKQGALDPSISTRIQDALLGLNPDLERVAELRQLAEGIVRERLGASA